ncbi:Ycf51 family protein [Leptolyngbya sp. O-77]|uniref:Ycf51 family protein n=1 Tax=Leptolyngbya sp. O-77 TaxID=1080068 RepID=UPI00074D44A4|nr:Ycf51 family protein [Leptolyngbya sp. O-77]BAU44319.1 hypothetical protein O77CONTIG1_04158 [Leptolyngbya sp. O-77]
MPTPAEFLTATQWAGVITLVAGAIAALGFLFSWGIRFRFVGITGFMAVLTVGLFALSLMPITRVEIPGAVRFSTVYDSGSTQVVIAVPPDITKEQLTATLQQAASDLFSPGRLGRGGENQMTIRARTVTHPKAGLTQLVYLGQVKRSLFDRNDDKMEISIFEE